jgi:probable phosphoglycerate mutase
MVKIYWIRHGETFYNQSNRFQGMLDVPLSDRGRQQAATLAEVFRPGTVEAVVASDLERARATAEPLAHRLGVPLVLRPGLRERHLGRRQGQPVWPGGFSQPGDGIETGPRFRFRVHQELRWLLAQPWRAVAVVAHGGVLRMAAELMGADLRPRFGNASVTLWERQAGATWILHYSNASWTESRP